MNFLLLLECFTIYPKKSSMVISTLHLFLTLVLLPIHLSFGNNITLNSTLSTNDNNPVWLSSSGEFAFGFYQINDTDQNHNNLFLLAIWYNKIPDKTIVWNARTGNPIPKGSIVQLTATGLTLSNPQGEATWTAEPGGSETVSYGSMLDTGNFVLASTGSTSTYVWESFKNPTDTLLPGQNLDVQGTLTSRLTESNYTKGRFQLYFDNGTMFLNSIGWPDAKTDSRYTSYFRLNSNDSTSQLVFDSKADIYVKKMNGEKVPLGWAESFPDPDAFYYRATVDFYGVFTQYAHPKGSGGQQGWSIVRYVPDDICFAIFSDYGSGSCGYNSYCSMENQRPACKCPEGYSLIDPKNQFGGCRPDFSVGCGADDEGSRDRPEEVFEIKVLEDVDWPLSDYERLDDYTSQDCQTTCLHDCFCVVAIFVKSTSTCWKKKFPLSNGRSNTTEGHVAFIKTKIQSLRDIHPDSP